MLEIGSLVDGKYKILNKIGQGGMSIVYLAMNERANKQWAIKEVRKDGVQDFEVIKQGLVVEIDMLKQLDHPNLPSIIDVIDEDDTFLIVMDYIEGNPLSYALKEYGAQPQENVVEWAKQLCDVLGYLHSREPAIVYRDMKPSNVMLKPDGKVTLIDFGTARTFKASSVEDTKCLGTQGYAAPEQYGGHGQTDARTDIYCLGSSMYHLVTGHNPCEPPYEMYPIRHWDPGLSSGLEQIILKCTQRNPDDRYQSCAELLYALEHYKELDEGYRRVMNRKLRTFVTTSVLTAVCLAGTIGCRLLETKTTTDNYARYVKEAETATESSEKIQKYTDAIDLNPSKGEAYNGLLNTFMDDNDLSANEDQQMKSIMYKNDSGSKQNIQYLESNQKDYAEFAYNLGLAYYFSSTTGKSAAARWLGDAQEGGLMDAQKQGFTEKLYKMASYYEELNKVDALGVSEVSYSEYWIDLKGLLDEGTTDETNVNMRLLIYKEMVNQIATNCDKFRAAAVSKSDIEKQLDMIEKEVGSDTIQGAASSGGDNAVTIQQLIDTINENMIFAEQSLDNAYSKTANITDSSGAAEEKEATENE